MEEKVYYNYKVNRQGQRKYNYKVNRQGQRKYITNTKLIDKDRESTLQLQS